MWKNSTANLYTLIDNSYSDKVSRTVLLPD
jgi:hypothetical protein